MKKLDGKVAIVTGANQGLGLEIARSYVQQGARVVACARNGERLREAFSEPGLRGIDGRASLTLEADVSREGDVAAVVKAALDAFGRVDILVNNAGIYGPKGTIEEVDWTEWMRTIEINVFGSVMMCRAVLPLFKAQRSGKIIQLSGGGATNPLPRISAYAASKAAIIRFVETLAEEVRENRIDVNAIAPGALNTSMLDEVLAAGPDKVGQAFFDKALKQRDSGGTSLQAGAELAVFLGSADSDGITGKLVSAVWDPWAKFGEHLDELGSTDIYTLRRIVPGDRGMDWGDK
ncbi:3-oxoacyl-ACP reductase FabG [soil metagenome]